MNLNKRKAARYSCDSAKLKMKVRKNWKQQKKKEKRKIVVQYVDREKRKTKSRCCFFIWKDAMINIDFICLYLVILLILITIFQKIIRKHPNFIIKVESKVERKSLCKFKNHLGPYTLLMGQTCRFYLPGPDWRYWAKQRPWALCHERKWKMPKGKSTFALELPRWSCWFCV